MRLATATSPLYSFGLCWSLANSVAKPNLGAHRKETAPGNTRGRRSLLLLVLGHRGWLTGGVGGTAPMPLKGELGHVDLVPVAGCSTTAASRQCAYAPQRVPPSMPGGSRENRLVEEWADQVCRDELRHSNLALACFRGCNSQDNVRLVGTLNYRSFPLRTTPQPMVREGINYWAIPEPSGERSCMETNRLGGAI